MRCCGRLRQDEGGASHPHNTAAPGISERHETNTSFCPRLPPPPLNLPQVTHFSHAQIRRPYAFHSWDVFVKITQIIVVTFSLCTVIFVRHSFSSSQPKDNLSTPLVLLSIETSMSRVAPDLIKLNNDSISVLFVHHSYMDKLLHTHSLYKHDHGDSMPGIKSGTFGYRTSVVTTLYSLQPTQ